MLAPGFKAKQSEGDYKVVLVQLVQINLILVFSFTFLSLCLVFVLLIFKVERECTAGEHWLGEGWVS